MELIIALVLFVALVGTWFFLPSSPEKAAGHGSVPASAGKASRTA